jgi:putative transposase
MCMPDNGTELTQNGDAALVPEQPTRVDLLHRAGQDQQNALEESFNGKLRYELLSAEIFYMLKEAKTRIEAWRRDYNTMHLHSPLNI